MCYLKLIFWDKGHLYANCLFYIVDIYFKYLLLQFFRCGIGMLILILTFVQKGRITCWKMVLFC